MACCLRQTATPVHNRSRVNAWLLGATLLTVACASGAPPSRDASTQREYPGTLRPPAALGTDFQWRQQVTAKWPQGTRSFDAVLSKSGDELLLVGLGPMDTPGYVLRLDAQAQLHFENHTGEEMRFNPRYVLLDVQRVFYPWFPEGLKSGTREVSVDQEHVTETWKDGVLTERTFQRLDNDPPGKITVTYVGWKPGSRAPERAVLNNGWFGYSMTIETFEQSSP